jgi:hypothetical protein
MLPISTPGGKPLPALSNFLAKMYKKAIAARAGVV